jgi:hypothetical protein
MIKDSMYKAGQQVSLDFPTTGATEYRQSFSYFSSTKAPESSLTQWSRKLTQLNSLPNSLLSLHSSLSTPLSPVVVYSGLASEAVLINADGTTTLPAGLQGIAYAVVSTSADAKAVTDDNTVAGPIILSFGLATDEVSTPFAPSM